MKKLISISAFVLMMVIVFNCKRTDLVRHYDELKAKKDWLQIRIENNKIVPDYLKQGLSQNRFAGFSYTGTTNLQSGTFYGLSSTVTIPQWSAGSANMKSFWNAVYFNQYYDSTLGRIRQLWIQWGWGVHKTYGDLPILAIYDLFGGGEIEYFPYRLVNNGTILNAGDIVKFTINLIPGTSILQLSRNDIIIWEFTFPDGAKVGFNRAEFMVEAWAPTPPSMATVSAYPAIETMDFNNNWSDLKFAHISQIQTNTHIKAKYQGYPFDNGFDIGSKVKSDAILGDTLWYEK